MCVCVKTEKGALCFILLYSLTVTKMTNASNKAKNALDDFMKRSKIDQHEDYKAPTDVLTTKWGVNQFGWPAKCPRADCRKISCVYVQRNGKKLRVPVCRHSDGTESYLYAEDPYIAKCQRKKDDFTKKSE